MAVICTLVALTRASVLPVVAAVLVAWVLAYYLTVQLVESNVLGPRISGRAVGLHPAASLLALITGAELFGFWGAVLAVPLAGLIYVVGAAIVHHVTGRAAIKMVEPRIRQQLA